VYLIVFRTYTNGAFLRCTTQNNPHRTTYTPRIILFVRLELHPFVYVLLFIIKKCPHRGHFRYVKSTIGNAHVKLAPRGHKLKVIEFIKRAPYQVTHDFGTGVESTPCTELVEG